MQPMLPEGDFLAGRDTGRPPVRILLLEDDPSYAQFVCHHLQGVSWAEPHVEVVETLAAALKRLAETDFDLVISDLNVPDSSQEATIKALAAVFKQPIIGMTADDDRGLRRRAMLGGAYEFLLKSELNRTSLERPVRLAVMQARALRSLKESEARFRSLTELSSDWFWEQDEHFRFTKFEGVTIEGIAAKVGRSLEGVIGKRRWEQNCKILSGQTWDEHRRTLEQHQPFRDLELGFYDEAGDLVSVALVSGEPVFERDSHFCGYRGVGRDITERKWLERELSKKESELRVIMDAVPATIAHVDADERYLYANRAHGLMYGVEPAEIIGRTVLQVLGEEAYSRTQAHRVRVLNGEAVSFERTHRRPDGIERILSIIQVPDFDATGRVTGFYSLGTDITDRKEAEERIRYMAQHDALTGLPNRLLFEDRISQAIAQAHRNNKRVGVLFIDLDHFKHINDSLGHHIGDRLLQAAAERLQRCLREGDSVCRLGGDEFVISLPSLADSQDATVVANKVLEAFSRPFEVDGRELHVGGSIGISVSPEDGEDATVLMRAADTAMYHAKEKGRGNYRFFTAALNEAAQQRLAMANQLRQALAQGEFALHYQPQVDLESGRIFSVEALLRWQRPGREPISCGDFISVAEETGLILPLGEWALREACEQLRRWRAAGHPEMQVAVNLSARQFHQSSFDGVVAQVLASSGLPGAALELEITESLLMLPSPENLVALERLASMGVRLSVDDFGMGYSSLAYLRRFPLHALKIDRSFVSGIGNDPSHTAIVTAIIAMAQSLRLKVVAEGVENAEQVTFLKARGCLAAQGYHYGRPMPAEEFEELLRQRSEPALPA